MAGTSPTPTQAFLVPAAIAGGDDGRGRSTRAVRRPWVSA
jgi:hypothetical protein